MDSPKPLLRDLSPTELHDMMGQLDQPTYRADQLSGWLYRHGVTSFDQMSNMPLTLRRKLAESYDLCGLRGVDRCVSADGTRKFLFRLRDGAAVESVIIPMQSHATFCLSSQVGCAMACRFCATAQGGLMRQLSPAEILEQVILLQSDLKADPFPTHGQRQFNIVLMGMGEPLHNWPRVAAALNILIHARGFGISSRRITVSTSGPDRAIEKLMAFEHPIGLTLSVGGPTESLRRRMMPVAGKQPLENTLDQASQYARRICRRVTLAIVMIAGVTDEPEDFMVLAELLRGRPFKVNLIPLNSLPDGDLCAASAPQVLACQAALTAAGVPAYIRDSGGQDIDAACGQLRRRHGQDATP